jgi:hypothetical protein
MKSSYHTLGRIGLVALVATIAMAPRQASAQDMGDAQMGVLQEYLVNAFERFKVWDVSMALAIPDSAMRWAPNEDVRDFAEQVEHGANNLFAVSAIFGEEPPGGFGDADVILNDKQALADAVAGSYDWIIERMKGLSAEALAEEVTFFGRSMTRWRVCTFALEHAMWTRGQLVPYFHAHGVPVPRQQLF